MSESEGLLLMSDDLAAILGSNALSTAPAGAGPRVSRLRLAPLKGGGSQVSFRTSDSELAASVVGSLTSGDIDLDLTCAGISLRLVGRASSVRVRSHGGDERGIIVCVAPTPPQYG